MSTYERLKEKALGLRANANEPLFADHQQRRFEREANDAETLLALVEAVREAGAKISMLKERKGIKDIYYDKGGIAAALARVMED